MQSTFDTYDRSLANLSYIRSTKVKIAIIFHNEENFLLLIANHEYWRTILIAIIAMHIAVLDVIMLDVQHELKLKYVLNVEYLILFLISRNN